MSQILRIEGALNAWAQVKNNACVVRRLFSNGSFFTITNSDFAQNSRYINEKLYAYLGIEDDNLVFILIPDSLDGKPLSDLTSAELESIVIKPFTADLLFNNNNLLKNCEDGPDISILDALKNYQLWQLNRNRYINCEVSNPKGFMDLFVMPKSNFEAAFNRNACTELYCSLGLRAENDDISVQGYIAEIISLGAGTNGMTVPYDTTVPSPPYGK